LRGADGGVGEVDQVAGGPEGAREGGEPQGRPQVASVAELVGRVQGQRRRGQRAGVRGFFGVGRLVQLCPRRRGPRAAQGFPAHQAGMGRRPHPDSLPRILGNAQIPSSFPIGTATSVCCDLDSLCVCAVMWRRARAGETGVEGAEGHRPAAGAGAGPARAQTTGRHAQVHARAAAGTGTRPGAPDALVR